MSTTPQARPYGGPTLFSYGFRPFFLSGAIWSALAIPLWIWSLTGGAAMGGHRDWHVHEMLFGVLSAIVAGFLTTAVPSWTGRPPLRGWALASLWSLWLVGRLAMLAETFIGPIAAWIDAAFLVVLAVVIGREVLAAKNWRNLPVGLLVGLLAGGNIAFHLTAAASARDLGVRLALSATACLLALIGGRITPNFSTNWLRQRGATKLPAAFSRLDMAALVATGLAGLAWTVLADHAVAGVLLVTAGVLNLVRVTRWQGLATLDEPLLAILHVGYIWLALGLVLLGVGVLTPFAPRAAGIHALSAGAIGVTCLAVMCRASRGHTGRPLSADTPTVTIFAAINLSAVMRVVAAFVPEFQSGLLILAAVFWTIAYGGFALFYGPLLWRKRA